jgi:type II secretory pathway pseudopilin PulG
MIRLRQQNRQGTTLIELLIFLAILGVVVAITLPLLFTATENRVLQQTVSIVERNGAQIMQNTELHIRQGQRILSPAIGQTGSVLVLQTGSDELDPVMIGVSSGSVYLIEHTTRERISSPQVAVQNFIVRNTSTSTSRQSVSLSFRLSRTIRLQLPHSYARNFETTIGLSPADVVGEYACGCLPPYCSAANTYAWEVCEDNSCLDGTSHLDCP